MGARKRKRHSSKATAVPASLAPTASPPVAVAAEPVGTAALLAKLLPEISVVAVALGLALVPRLQTPEMQGVLDVTLFVEFAFLFGQGTLTDVATRLRKSPPAWLAIALATGFGMVLLANARDLFGLLSEPGGVMFIGIVWSGVERLRELWTMPKASRAEKLRRRALVGGRIELLLAFFAVTMLIVGVTYMLDDTNGGVRALDGYLAWGVAAYFSLTALDVWRVHRPAFLARPKSLLRIDPLGIDYDVPP